MLHEHVNILKGGHGRGLGFCNGIDKKSIESTWLETVLPSFFYDFLPIIR